MNLDQSIEAGLAAMAIEATAGQRRQLGAHLELVSKWNRVHNLTAVRETSRMVVLHVLDSLSLLPHIGEARSMLDVGSGPGFPGIPVAIMRPALEVTLLDSSSKKCAFLEQARTSWASPTSAWPASASRRANRRRLSTWWFRVPSRTSRISSRSPRTCLPPVDACSR